MTSTHEAAVFAAFDAQQARFKTRVAHDDVRLRALLGAFGRVEGLRLLDLGCGKGRFASHLRDSGAEVVGLDLSAAMLAHAEGLARVRGSARRLPFADAAFDGVQAVEVFEHVAGRALDDVLDETRRVLRPGGIAAILDKNAGALDARRPWLPSLAVKWIDERRGLWMYPPGGPVRERWFWPGAFGRHLRRWFDAVRVDHLLSPDEAGHVVFRRWPRARLMTLWTARAPGGDLG